MNKDIGKGSTHAHLYYTKTKIFYEHCYFTSELLYQRDNVITYFLAMRVCCRCCWFFPYLYQKLFNHKRGE